MPKKVEMIGMKFNKLTVLEQNATSESKKLHYRCACECGAFSIVDGAALRSGNTKSCGCRRKVVSSDKAFKHGYVGTKTYGVWESIKKRCLDTKNRSYKDYGGRGITICDEWKDNFLSFLKDMGEAPEKCVIDRIDNEKSYEPGNCRWITQKENCRNKRNNIRLSLGGETRLLVEWAELLNVSQTILRKRHARGFTDEQVFYGLTPETSSCFHLSELRTKKLTFNGITDTLAGWSKRTGISSTALYQRTRRHGWSVEKTLTQGA
jgi:hypothetical protein